MYRMNTLRKNVWHVSSAETRSEAGFAVNFTNGLSIYAYLHVKNNTITTKVSLITQS